MTLPKPESSWRAATKVEKDCRIVANDRRRRRAAKKRIRARNIREGLGHPPNQMQHLRDQMLVKRLDPKIAGALYRIHIALLTEFMPRQEFSGIFSEAANVQR